MKNSIYAYLLGFSKSGMIIPLSLSWSSDRDSDSSASLPSMYVMSTGRSTISLALKYRCNIPLKSKDTFITIYSIWICQYLRSCGKVMFSQVCVKNSVHGGIWLSACWDALSMDRYPPPGQTHLPWAGTPPWADTPLGSPSLENSPPPQRLLQGTHPTGMHSCFDYIIFQI